MRSLQEVGFIVGTTRRTLGLKQKDVAAQAGIAAESLLRFEHGQVTEFGTRKLQESRDLRLAGRAMLYELSQNQDAEYRVRSAQREAWPEQGPHIPPERALPRIARAVLLARALLTHP
jgi:hypothetical protein